MIADCLKSLKFCDEIIVIDNDSIDRTEVICRQYAAEIFSITTSDFSEMRNFGKTKAANDWLLYVDADERVGGELKERILAVVKRDDFSGYEIHRKNNFFGVWMKSGGWENEYLLRLMKKDKLAGWRGKLHETAQVDGRIGRIEELILHFSHQDLGECVANTNVWSGIEAELRFADNHPKMTTLRFVKLFIKDFLTRIFVKKAYKDGAVGIIEAIYQPYSLLITYLKLWEKQDRKFKF